MMAGNWMPVFLMSIAGGVIVGFFGETGWTGLAMPRLPRCYGMTVVGLGACSLVIGLAVITGSSLWVYDFALAAVACGCDSRRGLWLG
jgi:hypothetical protein